MKIIGFGIQKGGTGKTTMSVSLGVKLAKEGKKVLLVDGDPQGNSSIATIKEKFDCEFVDLIQKTKTFDKVLCQSCLNENLFVLPTLPNSEKLRDYKQGNKVNFARYEIEDTIKNLSEYFDYCIIDTSPDFSAFEKHLFIMCDEIIPVLLCDKFANEGFYSFVSNLTDYFKSQRASVNIKNVILNRYNASMTTDKLVKEAIAKNTNYNYIIVPQDQSFKKSQLAMVWDDGKTQTQSVLNTLMGAIK